MPELPFAGIDSGCRLRLSPLVFARSESDGVLIRSENPKPGITLRMVPGLGETVRVGFEPTVPFWGTLL